MKRILLLSAVFLAGAVACLAAILVAGDQVLSPRPADPTAIPIHTFANMPWGQIGLGMGPDAGIGIVNGSASLDYTDHLYIGFVDRRPCIMLCDAAKTHGAERVVIDLYDLAKEHGKVLRSDRK